ncbi:hypothetical protein [Pseudomonas lurida]|uniref:hypothetical protein n=1 Tax=Pseudomonas lurida TaxID=244566 RepID=UPI00177A86B7|nr:hypothetical protein [Pseudomonas lurida]MBD8671605.1 hypothetical protein [Pseudomonas lurida]
MQLLKNVALLGDSLAYTHISSGLVWKVELCEVAAQGDYNLALYFDPLQGWTPARITRLEDSAVMIELEHYAQQLAPDAFALWCHMLDLAPGAEKVPESVRIKSAVDRVIAKHGVSQSAIAHRLNIQQRSLREYCEGTTKGTMGPALLLALDALASRSTFE